MNGGTNMKKILNFLVDVLLATLAFVIADYVTTDVFCSENFWIKLFVFVIGYILAFGTQCIIMSCLKKTDR